MGYSTEQLNDIYDKTGGQCRFCEKKLAWKNYGQYGSRGAWEVDHSRPKAQGGTDHLSNLFPTCIPCNREKSDQHGRYFVPSSTRKSSDDSNWVPLLIGVGVLVFAPTLLPVL